MKIQTESREVVATGIGRQRNFSVEVGAHIMAVLSGLYKDPLDAIVREYLTNMYDAYVALGPYDDADHPPPVLHLPNVMEPWLEFTDYGIGMSVDTVWNIYSTYGATTKSENNTEVGGFGLGSKTAFCYQNGQAWTIESRYNGKKYIFMASLDEKALPTLYHASTTETDQPNGVTIRIPIHRIDIDAVIRSASKYVPYFPMELTILGHPEPESFKESRPTLLEGEGWKIREVMRDGHGEYTGRYGYNNIYVIMGNVPYLLDGDLYNLIWTLLYKSIGSSGGYKVVEIYVPIGSVDLVPSRDHLKDTPKTRDTLKEYVTKMIGDYKPSIKRKSDTIPTEYERMLWREAMTRINLLPRDMSVEYKVKASALRSMDTSISVEVHTTENGSGAYNREPLSGSLDEISIHDSHFYVILNDVRNGSQVAHYLLREKCYRKTRSGRKASNGHRRGTALLISRAGTFTENHYKRISRALGGFPVENIILASKFSDIARSVMKEKSAVNLYKLSKSGLRWEARVRVPNDESVKYYLVLTNDSLGNNNYTYRGIAETDAEAIEDSSRSQARLSISDLQRVVSSLTGNGTFRWPETIYGIRKGEENLVAGDKWIKLDSHVKELVRAEWTSRIKSPNFMIINEEDGFVKLESSDWWHVVATEFAGLDKPTSPGLLSTCVRLGKQIKDNKIRCVFPIYVKANLPDLWEEMKKASNRRIRYINKIENDVKSQYPLFWSIVCTFVEIRWGAQGDKPKRDRAQAMKMILDYFESM